MSELSYTVRSQDFMDNDFIVRQTNTLYIKIQLKTGKRYLGVTYRKDASKYRGSGALWLDYLKKYGNNVRTKILFKSDNIEEFSRVATEVSKRLNVVYSDKYVNIKEETGLNATRTKRKIYGDDTIDKAYEVGVDGIIQTRKRNSKDAIYQITDTYEDKKSSSLDLDEDIYRKQMKIKLVVALSKLTTREERVLRMRFGLGLISDHTLEEVGQQFSVTRDRIRQIEAKDLRKLKSLELTKYLFDNLGMVA